jgi:hypothetical protein
VVRKSPIRLLLALAVEYDMEIYHFDVCTAFLNGDVDEEVYISQHDGLTVKGKEDKVCLLHNLRSQAIFYWNVKVTNVLTKIRYKNSVNETCIFYKIIGSKVTTVALYVDDFLVVSNDSEEKKSLKGELEVRFKIKDLGGEADPGNGDSSRQGDGYYPY